MLWQKHLVSLCLLLFMPHICAAWIEEQEPNNSVAQANLAACGDTVRCGFLSSVVDVDYFRFTGTAGDSLVLLTFGCDGSSTDTRLVLYAAPDSILAVNDNGGPEAFSQIRYFLTQTADYYVCVLRAGPSPDSTYNLWIGCPDPPPENYDLCETARVIPALPYYDEGSTQGQSHQAGFPAPDVFYVYENPVLSNITFTVCTEFFDARVQLLLRCIGDYWDDATTGCGLGAVLSSYNLAPGPYYIMIEGFQANQSGAFSLEVTAQMPDCPAPAAVVLARVGGYPLIDWPEQPGPSYYIVWRCGAADGEYEHLGTTPSTFFVDSSGFSSLRLFYRVTSVCPW